MIDHNLDAPQCIKHAYNSAGDYLKVGFTDTGFSVSEYARNAYASTNVTTGAYVQLIASTANAYQKILIFDSSGQTLKLAFGAAASEVDKFIIPPGGTDPIEFSIPAGTRISIRAISATASSGEIDIQLLG